MKPVSPKGLIPMSLSGLILVASPAIQTFNYNDLKENNIQLVDNQALIHLRSVDNETFYGAHIHRYKFYQAYYSWIENIRYVSSPFEVINEPNFNTIVGLGLSAVPFIAEELQKKPNYLVWALNQIFGFKISDNPDTTIPEACKSWVRYIKSLNNA